MNEYNPCVGCDYYNKPYWSVVSPCKSCPRTYGTGTITSNVTIPYLPTAKEYRDMANALTFQLTTQWSEPKYQCPKCGGGMRRNEMVVLTTYPAMYEYQCDKCGHVDYQHI